MKFYLVSLYFNFVIIENQNPIKLSNCTLNSLDEDLYDDINMVEMKDGIIKVLVFLDNDVNVSFVMNITDDVGLFHSFTRYFCV